MITDRYFLEKAQSLCPSLLHQNVTRQGDMRVLSTGDEQVFDLGNHYVGYVTIDFESTGHHQDAPLYVRLQFAERLCEFDEDPKDYHGWISPSWIQSEELHIDVLPRSLRLERRYALRYVKVTVLSASGNFSVMIPRISIDAVSSADDLSVEPFRGQECDRRLDEVSLRTLHECMQLVFEDGPKRDRRLWLGDLRLQALTNYETFRNNDLVKRCLYLFASSRLDDGRVASNIFIEPEVECDFQSSFDYSLFFINTLLDYYRATGDLQTLKELEGVARDQYEIIRDTCFDESGMVDTSRTGICFIDWNLELDKQAPAMGVYLYAAKALCELEEILGNDVCAIREDIERKTEAARTLFDEKTGLYVSGKDRQVSYASQVWLVLGGVASFEQLEKVSSYEGALVMVSPYMYHHYIQACIMCNRKDEALKALRGYWGQMTDLGCDTFFELFNPDNPDESPYGGTIVNSYCHAWSCTPSYFLRKYFTL